MSWANACLKFVPEGRPVIDPMLGSGTLLVAARRLGYPAIGIDSDEAACEIAATRLGQRMLPLEAML
jgi:tRNA G10  N-methylase Trm11